MSRAHMLRVLLTMLVLSPGCATALRGDKQKMKFQTDPPGATVNIDGTAHTAPAEVALKRNQPHTIVVCHPGYQSIQFELKPQWDGASLGNIVLPGGSVGFGIDTLSGADRSFRTLATIKLHKATSVSTQPVTMYTHRGKVLTKEQYDAAMKEEREYHSRPVFGE